MLWVISQRSVGPKKPVDVVFGHGIGGLDKFANTFIKGGAVTDPRLHHVEFVPDGASLQQAQRRMSEKC